MLDPFFLPTHHISFIFRPKKLDVVAPNWRFFLPTYVPTGENPLKSRSVWIILPLHKCSVLVKHVFTTSMQMWERRIQADSQISSIRHPRVFPPEQRPCDVYTTAPEQPKGTSAHPAHALIRFRFQTCDTKVFGQRTACFLSSPPLFMEPSSLSARRRRWQLL